MVPSLYQHILQDCAINLILRPEWLEHVCILANRVLPTHTDMRSDTYCKGMASDTLSPATGKAFWGANKVLNKNHFSALIFDQISAAASLTRE